VVQQHCQLWCADAQLLLGHVQLAAAVEACSGSSSDTSRRGALGLQQLRDQGLLDMLCWGAGQCYSSCVSLLQADQRGTSGGGSLARGAAACCLSMHLSGACVALLEALVLSGCADGQLAWLRQQLGQQAGVLCQLGQQSGGDAGLQGFVGQCVAAGGVKALCPTAGSGTGVLGLQLLLSAYSGGAGHALVCEPLALLPRLQQLLDGLN
jgi:hypothetical protein